jgi:hypothetical protein
MQNFAARAQNSQYLSRLAQPLVQLFTPTSFLGKVFA